MNCRTCNRPATVVIYTTVCLPVLQLLIFLCAHQLLSEGNHQCVMALTPNSSPMLVTPDSCSGNTAALPTLLLERLTQLLEAEYSSTQDMAGEGTGWQGVKPASCSAGLSSISRCCWTAGSMCA